ncbi:uncharacterized protein LOC129614352 [Condylostylus longicornis]|uniref:uncharacterized protein LOC129614352 n=1 Tax=Condylostylus longicornis TaxID=2530218 RepID=UPI00244E21F2|nr:uncharacterized protein LOC129614352 [Condylostylus longicornis]
MSSNVVSISSFNLLFFTQVLTVLTTTTIKYNEYITDKGKNISISCKATGSNTMWVKQNGKKFDIVQDGSILSLTNVTKADTGIYMCLSSDSNEDILNDEQIYVNSLDELDLNNNSYTKSLSLNLTVRTTPGPVSQLYFKASTILGFLIWRFNKSNSGGYPLRSFTAEYRYIPDNVTADIDSIEWIKLDPINIAPNVRQMEVYKLEPNSTYEFRIWGNNKLGPGEIVTTNVTTLPEMSDEDVLRLIIKDLENFDVRIWIAAVALVLGALVILAIGLTVTLAVECYQYPSLVDFEDGWGSTELVPNIILNPGFCENDDPDVPYTRTIIFGEDDESEGYDSDSQSSMEKPMEVFKRKVSIFFTGQTMRRI